MNQKTRQEAASVLREAAEVMEKGGIVRGIRWNSTGAHCALGAMDDVLMRRAGTDKRCLSDYSASADTLAEVVREIIPTDGFRDEYNNSQYITRQSSPAAVIAGWSNMLCKSEKDVACAMRAAATLIEEDEEAPNGD